MVPRRQGTPRPRATARRNPDLFFDVQKWGTLTGSPGMNDIHAGVFD